MNLPSSTQSQPLIDERLKQMISTHDGQLQKLSEKIGEMEQKAVQNEGDVLRKAHMAGISQFVVEQVRKAVVEASQVRVDRALRDQISKFEHDLKALQAQNLQLMRERAQERENHLKEQQGWLSAVQILHKRIEETQKMISPVPTFANEIPPPILEEPLGAVVAEKKENVTPPQTRVPSSQKSGGTKYELIPLSEDGSSKISPSRLLQMQFYKKQPQMMV